MLCYLSVIISPYVLSVLIRSVTVQHVCSTTYEVEVKQLTKVQHSILQSMEVLTESLNSLTFCDEYCERCLKNPKNIIILECSHLSLCQDCFNKTLQYPTCDGFSYLIVIIYHLSLCDDCFRTMTQCPICDTFITTSISVFM